MSILYFQGVGIDIIDIEFFLQVVAEIGKSAGNDRGFESKVVQVMKERFSPFSKLQSLGNGFKDMLIQSLQQGYPPLQTAGKVDLPPASLVL